MILLVQLVGFFAFAPGGSLAAQRLSAFERHFRQLRSFALEDTAPHFLLRIDHLKERSSGGFIVIDGGAHTVRLHGENGELVAVLGGSGRGPGEFIAPRNAFEAPDGMLWVSDGGQPRLTRFSGDTHRPDVTPLTHPAWQVEGLPEGKLVHVRTDSALLALIDENGRIQRAFAAPDESLRTTPYWGSIVTHHAMVADGRILLATSLFYPLRVFSFEGDSTGVFGTPPRSWTAVPKPQAGAFIPGPDYASKLREWLQSFRVIAGLHSHRQRIIVSHARMEPDVRGVRRLVEYTIDMYDAGGNKLAEDVPVPGRFLSGGRYVYVLLSEPPDGWRIAVYEAR